MRISKGIVAAGVIATIGMIGSQSIMTAQAEEPLKITIATEGAYPPFNFVKPDGSLAGFDVDIAKALCEEMKADCKIIAQEWDGAIPALQADKFDAYIASMQITEERKKQVDFSEKYYSTPPAIAAPKGTDIKGVTKEDLAGKTIGVQISTTHANYAEAIYTDSEVRTYPTAEEYRLDLANGRLDAVNDNSTTLIDWLKSEDGACCKLVGTFPSVVEFHGPGTGIAFKKGRQELIDKFNAAIKAIRKNGKYKEINDQYFDFDAYGDEN